MSDEGKRDSRLNVRIAWEKIVRYKLAAKQDNRTLSNWIEYILDKAAATAAIAVVEKKGEG